MFREVRTGETVRVEQGTFDLNLPPGIYAAEYGGATQTVTVVAGGDYELELDPARAITVDLSTTQQSTTVILEAHVHGAGAHEMELHGFNVTIDTRRRQIDLGSGTAQTLMWTCSIQDVDGADLSPDVLAYCRAKTVQAGLKPALYAQAMHALDLSRRYRTIFICDSLGIGGQRAHDAEALCRCYQALEPGGALVFSHYLPYVATPWWPYWLPEQRPHLPMPWEEPAEPRLTADGTALQLQGRLFDLDPLEQRSTQQIRARRWSDGQVVAEEEYLLQSSQYFLHELELLLAQAGFVDVTVSAGYTNEAVTAAHTFVVFTARKSPEECQEPV